MRIPDNNNWTQTNSGTLFGFLNQTHGMQFDKRGMATLSKRPSMFYGSEQDSNFGYLKAIIYFNNTYNFITNDEFFYGDLAGANLTKTTGSVALGDGTDAAVVFGRLYVTGDTLADYWNGTAWNGTIGVSLTTGKEHPICNFENQTNDKLAIGNTNTVTLYDSSHVAGNTLTLPAEYEVTSLRYRNGYLYVGTKHINGGEARIFIWDGSGSEAQYGPGVQASWVFAMTEYGRGIAFVTNAGQLRIIEGASIGTLANFPIYNAEGKQWMGATNGLSPGGKVFNRGMIADGDRIYISIDGMNEGEWVHGMYSGLWAYDPNVGLYHKAGFTDDRQTGVTGSSLASNTITVSADIDSETGDPVLVTDAGSITGLTTGETYYAIKVDTDQLKFASTRYDAYAGNAITLGGSTASFSMRYLPATQNADYYDVKQGAVAIVSPLELPSTIWGGSVIYGGKSNSSVYGVNLLSLAKGVGSFTTQKIYGSNIKQIWQRLVPFIENFALNNEAVRIKIKTEERLGLPTTPRLALWDDSNSMTTQVKTGFGAVEVGDELFFLNGTPGGFTTHITAITENASTYTFDVDQSIGTASVGGDIIIDNFKLVQTITNQSPEVNIPDAVLHAEKSAWIQIRIEVVGYEISIPFMELISKVDKK